MSRQGENMGIFSLFDWLKFAIELTNQEWVSVKRQPVIGPGGQPAALKAWFILPNPDGHTYGYE